jgi:hypothetical protein
LIARNNYAASRTAQVVNVVDESQRNRTWLSGTAIVPNAMTARPLSDVEKRTE